MFNTRQAVGKDPSREPDHVHRYKVMLPQKWAMISAIRSASDRLALAASSSCRIVCRLRSVTSSTVRGASA